MHLTSIPHQTWGGCPWLCCCRLSRRPHAQFRKSDCGGPSPHEHLAPTGEGVGGSKSHHSTGTILRPFLIYSLERPHGTTPVTHNANRLINTSFLDLVSFLQFLIIISNWHHLSGKLPFPSPVSVCILRTQSALGWALLPPGFTYTVSSAPDIHLILTCPSRTWVRIIFSGRLFWSSLSPNGEGSCCSSHSHNANDMCQLEAPKERSGGILTLHRMPNTVHNADIIHALKISVEWMKLYWKW